MSKLGKNLTQRFMNERRYATRKLSPSELIPALNIAVAVNTSIEAKIRVAVTFGCDKWIPDTHIAKGPDSDTIVEETLNDIRSALLEQVFGEFRPLIIEMRSALYDEDRHRIRTLLSELEHQMFHENT